MCVRPSIHSADVRTQWSNHRRKNRKNNAAEVIGTIDKQSYSDSMFFQRVYKQTFVDNTEVYVKCERSGWDGGALIPPSSFHMLMYLGIYICTSKAGIYFRSVRF